MIIAPSESMWHGEWFRLCFQDVKHFPKSILFLRQEGARWGDMGQFCTWARHVCLWTMFVLRQHKSWLIWCQKALLPATQCWEPLGSKRMSLGSWSSIIIVLSLAWRAAEKWLRPSVSYDKPTEINTIFYIVLESDLSSLGKHKGAHLISPALLSESVLISPWLGWIYNAGNKDKCRRFKSACSWTLKVPLNRLGTSKCLLIYSWFLFSSFFFFSLFLFGIPDSDEGGFQYYCARKCWKFICAFHNT